MARYVTCTSVQPNPWCPNLDVQPRPLGAYLNTIGRATARVVRTALPLPVAPTTFRVRAALAVAPAATAAARIVATGRAPAALLGPPVASAASAAAAAAAAAAASLAVVPLPPRVAHRAVSLVELPSSPV